MELLKKRYLCDCGRWFFDIEGPILCAKNKHEIGYYVQEPHPIKTTQESNSSIALAPSPIVTHLVSRRPEQKRSQKTDLIQEL
jgi:hypothetical protein